ncbi:copper resistance CopC family protein [Isoptericola sp. NPDC019482]|uniref:copper resistance CopC family protein n=1 Tax=Isoptericola sp. NPDC019482 TaxID=3154688 RepID=UPI0034857BE3
MHPNLARRRRALAVLVPAVLALSTMLGVAVAQPASAHDRLLSSDPADGATVEEAPTELTLVFSADVLAAGAQVAVTTPDGTVPAEVAVDGDEAVAALPDDLPGGDWDVAWRVVSSDGHPIEGELAFTVDAPSPSPSVSPSTAESSPTTSATPTPSGDLTASAGHVHDGGGTPGADLDADGEAGWATAWLFPVAVLAVVGVAAAVLLQRRRRAADDAHDAGAGPHKTGEPREPGETPGDDDRPAT